MNIWILTSAYGDLIVWVIIGTIVLSGFYPIYRRIQDIRLIETVTFFDRGTKSERDLVLKLLKHGIPAQTIFHDLCLQKPNGKFAQIDLVLATTEGIIVFEVKDYAGWIYGSGNYTSWTKVMSKGGEKHRFYNPIKQNNSHISALKGKLRQFRNIPFYSIVVFYGDCKLKDINYVPKGTYIVKPARLFEVLELIKQNNDPAPYTNKREVVNFLNQAVKNGENKENQQQHVEDVRDLVGKDRIFG